MNNNKKLVIKVLAAGLVVASVAGTTLGFVQKSNANEVQNQSVERRVSGMYAKRYLNSYMETMPYMTNEEFCEVFTDEEFAASIRELCNESNTRGGGSLANKLQNLSSGQISDIANKIKDKLPKSILEDTGLAEDGKIEDVLNELKDTVSEDDSEEPSDGEPTPTEDPSASLLDAIKIILIKLGVKDPAATAAAHVIVGILALFGVK